MKAMALVMCVALAACRAEPASFDAHYLSIRSEVAVEQVVVTWRRAPEATLWPGVSAGDVTIALADVGALHERDYVLRVVSGALARGSAWLVIRGLVGGRVAARAFVVHDLEQHALTLVTLAPVGCADEDGDGFCVDDASPWSDCDDARSHLSPLEPCTGALEADGGDAGAEPIAPPEHGLGPCVAFHCDQAGCSAGPAADETGCDDGDPCTVDDVCTSGACAGSPKDCADADACTADACAAGACTHTATPCDDGDPCTTDACDVKTGTCTAEPAADGLACASGICRTGRCLSPMTSIAKGSFPMGAAGNEGSADEHPRHTVTLSAFAIDTREVTNADFGLFLASHGNTCEGGACYGCSGAILCGSSAVVPPAAAPLPATDVTWHGARAFCAWAGKRLPTEAEWERAAAGPPDGTGAVTRRFPWGDACPPAFGVGAGACTSAPWTGDSALANCVEAQCGDGLSGPGPAGGFAGGASAEGVLDLAGNVAEWVEDAYDAAAYSKCADECADPLTVDTAADRVVRGGSYAGAGTKLRAASRGHAAPVAALPYVGFRCAEDDP